MVGWTFSMNGFYPHKTTSEKYDYRNVPLQGFIASME